MKRRKYRVINAGDDIVHHFKLGEIVECVEDGPPPWGKSSGVANFRNSDGLYQTLYWSDVSCTISYKVERLRQICG